MQNVFLYGIRGALAALVLTALTGSVLCAPNDGEAPSTALPYRGSRDLTASERHTLYHLPWAGNPEPAQLARLRDAWRAMTVKDDTRARELVNQAAEAGDPNAQFILAGVLLGGDKPKERYPEAESMLIKAAGAGQPTAAHWLGRIRDRGSYGQPVEKAEAFYWYRMADALGHPDAAAQLCYAYADGNDVRRDPRQALIFCQRGAERGSAGAMDRLGYMYTWGIAVPRDQEKAFEWVMKAAVAGYPSAERAIGLRLLHGNGARQDLVQAMHWLARAADHGDADAFNELGVIYRDGLTGQVDLPKASVWFRIAASKGSAAGRYHYAGALEAGLGVNRDPVQAYNYYSLAALQGYVKAEGPLARLGASLSKEDMKRASDMVDRGRSRRASE